MKQGTEEFWKNEWNGMPEFNQQSKMPVKSIKINFISLEDYFKFAGLVGQNLTPKTKSIWYPKQENIIPSDFLYKSDL